MLLISLLAYGMSSNDYLVICLTGDSDWQSLLAHSLVLTLIQSHTSSKIVIIHRTVSFNRLKLLEIKLNVCGSVVPVLVYCASCY